MEIKDIIKSGSEKNQAILEHLAAAWTAAVEAHGQGSGYPNQIVRLMTNFGVKANLAKPFLQKKAGLEIKVNGGKYTEAKMQAPEKKMAQVAKSWPLKVEQIKPLVSEQQQPEPQGPTYESVAAVEVASEAVKPKGRPKKQHDESNIS
jgi:hypothetical protein